MTSRKFYFALLVNVAIAVLVGCSSEKADDDFDLSGFNAEEFQVDNDPLVFGAVPRCKSVNRALLKKTTFSKDIDRVVARHRGDILDTCAGHGVFKKTCIERTFGSVSPGSVKKVDEYDIKVKGSLSKNEVVRVLRQRTPGLRHVYNKSLKKKNPNFEGLVKLKLVVNSSGEVDSVSVVHSTTGFEEFDEEIKTAVGRYKFQKVDSGNTAIEIPLEFVLNENAKDAK